MAKRYISTETFDDDWFSDLGQEAKIFWFYFITKCDHAGILKLNRKLAKFQTGINDIDAAIKELESRLVNLGPDVYFCPKFLVYQYPNFPQSAVRAQDSAIKILQKYDITMEKINEYLNPLVTLSKPLANPLLTLTKPLTNPLVTLSKPLAKGYDNDNDNDNDNDKLKKDRGLGGKEKTLAVQPKPNTLTDNLNLLQTVEMHNGLPPGSAATLAKVFYEIQSSTGNLEGKTIKDYQMHFSNWARKQAQAIKANTTSKAETVQDTFKRWEAQLSQNPEAFYQQALSSYHE
jgi:hypothetical protein